MTADVANAAHELRTPLTVEHALLEESLIDARATVESYRANFEQLLAVNRHRGALLESLLTLAGSESARQEAEPVELDEVVTAALTERSTELERHGLRAETVIRAATMVGDRMLLTRLVANLIDNAIDYNEPSGTVEVGVRTIDGRVRLIVANTGVRVPPGEVERLFEPFQRLRRVSDDGRHGLGLSIVRAIAQAHAAQLTAEARPGGGLSVEVLFPAPEPPQHRAGQRFLSSVPHPRVAHRACTDRPARCGGSSPQPARRIDAIVRQVG